MEEEEKESRERKGEEEGRDRGERKNSLSYKAAGLNTWHSDSIT